MTLPDNESVTYDIRLEAQKALITLSELTNSTTKFADKVAYARAQVQSFAKETGMGFEAAKKSISDLDKEISGTTASSVVFGASGQEAWKKVGNAAEEAGSKAEKGASKATFATRALSIAIGMLIHQGLNLLINTFQTMFTMAIKGLRELETATYNLVNAEKTLSQQGISITPQGLDQTIQKLQQLDPLLSKIQATEVVSRTATLIAPQLGLDAKDIDQISRSVAVLAVQNRGLGVSFEEVESALSNGLLSGRVSATINKLGVKINDQLVQEEAIRLGLVKTGEEYDKLTGKVASYVKAKAMVSLIAKTTNPQEANLPQFFDTADARIGILQARISDFFTQLGTIAAPIIIKVVNLLIDGFTKASEWVANNKDALTLWADVMGNVLVITVKVLGFLIKIGTAFGYIGIAISNATDKLQKFIEKTPFLKKIADALGFKGIGSYSDTPTGSPSSIDTAKQQENNQKSLDAQKEYEEKFSEIMKDNRDKRLDIERNYQEKLQDIALNYAQKLEDIARNTEEKVSDAQRNYADKVEDINRDTEEKKIEARQEANKRSVEIEKQYQDELKKLRDKYLLDLEDALHERDARQILRLMRQYEIDKQNAKKQKETEQQKSQQDLQQKLQDIERDRRLKLEQAKRDLADKLRDIQISAARERQEANLNRQRQLNDARIAHQRALEEQRIYLQRKLRDLAEAIQKEYNLTASGLNAIDSLLSSYALAASTIGSTGNASSPSSINAGTYVPSTNSGFSGSGMYGTGGMAEGGTFLATRPQTINVGENRPEVITAAPLGRPGRDISKIFSNSPSGGMSGGQIEIAMTLSPDLEARIIRNTMDETASVVARINRTK